MPTAFQIIPGCAQKNCTYHKFLKMTEAVESPWSKNLEHSKPEPRTVCQNLNPSTQHLIRKFKEYNRFWCQ